MNDFDVLILADLAVIFLAAGLAVRGNVGFYMRRRPQPRKDHQS